MSRLSKRTTWKPFAANASHKASGHATSCIPRPITRRIVGRAGSPHDAYSSSSESSEIFGTIRVVVEPLPPTLAMERLPLALGLREAIGDRVPRSRIHADAQVAR